MAILEQNFYNKTIKLYTGVFGSVFNNISIVREDNKSIKVPISYGGQQKQNVIQEHQDEVSSTRYKMRLPRMSFGLTGWQKDDSRVINKRHTLQSATANRSNPLGIKSQLNRVPYNFTYELSVKTKHIDDMLQIVEQILVYFNPSIEIEVADNPNIDGSTSLNLTLESSAMDDNYEGSYEDGRVIESSFIFNLEGYLYMPTSDAAVINKVIINYYDLLNNDFLIDTDTYDESDL